MEDQPTKRKKRWWLWITLGLAGFPCLWLVVEMLWVNAYMLPDSLVAAPIAPPPPRTVIKASGSTLSLLMPPRPTENYDSYEDYLKKELDRDQTLGSARLYLQMASRYKDENFFEEFDKHFPYFTTSTLPSNLPRTFSTEQVRWVREKAPLITLVRRWCQSSPLPAPSILDQADYALRLGKSLPNPDTFMICQLVELSATESWLRYQEGDYAGARQSISDIYEFTRQINQFDDITIRTMLIGILATANRSTRLWMQDPVFPKSDLAALHTALDEVEPLLFQPEQLARTYTSDYLQTRALIVHVMRQPGWLSALYGWGRIERAGTSMCGYPREYTIYWDVPLLGTTKVPNLPTVIPDAFLAMNNRLDSDAALREYDAVMLQAIRLAGQPYPAVAAAAPGFSDPKRFHHFLMPNLCPDLPGRKTWLLGHETGTHLLRLGLGLRVARRETLDLRNANIAGDPHNPWHDPFTGEAMRMTETSTSTLIYSLGPDQKDQQGKVVYGQGWDSLSREGDIVIHVPREMLEKR